MVNVVKGPFTDGEIQLIERAYQAEKGELTKDLRKDVVWTDEEMEVAREVFKAQVTKLGKFLHDAGGDNDKILEKVGYEYDKYKELYKTFGGDDPIG